MTHRLLQYRSVAALCLLLGWAASPVVAADEFDQELAAAVKQLRAESEFLDQVEPDPAAKPVFDRPHKLVRNWDPDRAARVMKAVTDNYSGDEERDAYIRYHLIYVVEKHLIDALVACYQEGESFNPELYKPDPDLLSRLDSLARTMPEATLAAAYKRASWQEPAELAAKYGALNGSTAVTVGTPPFTETLTGRASLPT